MDKHLSYKKFFLLLVVIATSYGGNAYSQAVITPRVVTTPAVTVTTPATNINPVPAVIETAPMAVTTSDTIASVTSTVPIVTRIEPPVPDPVSYAVPPCNENSTNQTFFRVINLVPTVTYSPEMPEF